MDGNEVTARSEASNMKVAHPVSLATVSPALPHDCPTCRFLGTLDSEDLYVCERGPQPANSPEYVRRFGAEDHEYGSLGDYAPTGSAYSLAKALAERNLPPRKYVTLTR